MKLKYPELKANYSLQFIVGYMGILDMVETCQGGDLNCPMQFKKFGVEIAKSKFLNVKEKIAFREFCKSYLDETNKRIRIRRV